MFDCDYFRNSFNKIQTASYHLIDLIFIGVVGLFIYVGCHVS